MNTYNICKVCGNNITKENEKHKLVKCDSCNLIFCQTICSQEDFVRIYDELYNKNSSHYDKHSKLEYERLRSNKKIKIGYNRYKLIEKNILNGNCQSVLEIGSGVGLLGCFLKQKAPTIAYTGIEIDKEAYTKSKLLGLNTINADFKEIQNLDRKFDVIMLWEVIEHLQDLKLFVDLAYSKLNSNGKVILSTPNYDKIYNYPNRKFDDIFQDAPPIHLNFFTKKSITNVFILSGFRECKVRLKRFPFFELKKIRFYINSIKSLLGKYNGSTIYFEATK